MNHPIIENFYAADGTKIIFRYWQPHNDNQRVMVLLHRGHEHSGRTEELADSFVKQGYRVYAWDARGNGLSEGERDYAESYSVFEDDLNRFIKRIQKDTNLPLSQFVLVASSMGALIAASWVHDYAPNIRGLILATTAFQIRLYVPFAESLLTLARQFNWMPRVSSYVKSKVLTHDRNEQKKYNKDELISSSISTDLLLDTLKTGRRIIDDAGAITTPILYLAAGKDWVVHRQPQRQFFERLSSEHKEWEYYPDNFHALFNEDNRETIFQRCHQFIERLFEAPIPSWDYSKADKYGYSRDRYDSMMLPSWNPLYAAARFGIRYLGGLSTGIKLGRNQGFDSGASLNYVYQNQPDGVSLLGKWIDRNYLNAAGWTGIRERKVMLYRLIEECLVSIESTANSDSSIHITDIAAGNGQYLFEILKNHDQVNAEFRELLPHNIDIMQQRTFELKLEDRLSLVQSDAFKLESYNEANYSDIFISSGLFELFTGNDEIKTAIKGIFQQLKPNGYYIYTNQPWHEQQQLIAKTLRNHRNQFWTMRCRTQAEMDALVESAGFVKTDMLMDTSGMFTVSVARKKTAAEQ